MIRWFVNMVIASFIFFPSREFDFKPGDLGLEHEEVSLVTEDGVKLHGWWLPSTTTASLPSKEARFTMLFFHGNAGNISHRLSEARGWVKRGVSILLFDYRGYGKSEGSIRQERDLYLDAKAAFGWLEKEKRRNSSDIILYGESVGAVPAVQLAAENRFKTVILEAPFTSLREMAKIHYGLAPGFLLKDFEMPNAQRIQKLKSPVFILHGAADEIVPLSMGRELFGLAPKPKEFFEVPGAGHNDLSLTAGETFYERPLGFVAAQSRTEIQVDSTEDHA